MSVPVSRRIMNARKKRILFLCTGNSCRSQMAEGWLRHLYGDQFESLSAGARPAGYVHENAVSVMAEVGVDISGQTSKHINEFLSPEERVPDIIIGVCSTADENCPVFPANVERWQWPFDDPFHAEGTDDEKMDAFRAVRDLIRRKLEMQFGSQ